jgi:hypothetical protein
MLYVLTLVLLGPRKAALLPNVGRYINKGCSDEGKEGNLDMILIIDYFPQFLVSPKIDVYRVLLCGIACHLCLHRS